jgi:hypothetical protein
VTRLRSNRTEPEQVIGRAARQIAAAAVQALAGLPLREQTELLDGLIRQHPRVFADVAELEPRRMRIRAVGDPREAARHHLVTLARRRDIDPQQHRRCPQRARARPRRRQRQRQRLLADELVTVTLDLADQAGTFLCRHARREQPLLAAREQAARGADAAHDELVQVLEHVAALALLAAPPRGQARHRELLVEEIPAQGRQEAQERVALDEP